MSKVRLTSISEEEPKRLDTSILLGSKTLVTYKTRQIKEIQLSEKTFSNG